MFKELVVNKLNGIGQKFTVHGDEIRTTCLNPEHIDSNPSFFINTKTGVSHCFACGYKPSPRRLLGISDDENVDELLWFAKYNNLLPEEAEEQESKTFNLPPKAYDIDRDWRGISKELLLELGVYYCDTGRFAGRLVFPIYQDAVLVGFDARIVNPSVVPEHVADVKWLRPAGMNVQNITYPIELITRRFPKGNKVVVVEGLLDAISYIQMGVPAIPSFGLSDPGAERIATLIRNGIETIAIGLDNDDRARLAVPRMFKAYVKWFKIENELLSYKIMKSGSKDANEYLVNHYKGNK